MGNCKLFLSLDQPHSSTQPSLSSVRPVHYLQLIVYPCCYHTFARLHISCLLQVKRGEHGPFIQLTMLPNTCNLDQKPHAAAFILGPRPTLLRPWSRPSLALTCRSSPGDCPRPAGPQCWSSSEPGSTWAWLSSPAGFCPVCSRTLILTRRRRTPPHPRACRLPHVTALGALSHAEGRKAAPAYYAPDGVATSRGKWIKQNRL